LVRRGAFILGRSRSLPRSQRNSRSEEISIDFLTWWPQV